MNLAEYGEALAYDTAFWYVGVLNPDYPLDELGKLSLEVSGRFRALAIYALVVQAESDSFLHNLIRSGKTREIYLRRLRQADNDDDHHQSSGRYEPLVDAIAAGEFELARSIVALSPTAFREGREYEDDYCYAQLLHCMVRPEPPESEMPPLLGRFEAYLNGQPSGRFSVCKALVERSQDDFDGGFESLLDERDSQIQADKERGQLEDVEVVAKRHIFVEGLALLRLCRSTRTPDGSRVSHVPVAGARSHA